MKSDDRLQPPVEKNAISISWRKSVDSRRLRRVAEILADIVALDSATTPEEGRQP